MNDDDDQQNLHDNNAVFDLIGSPLAYDRSGFQAEGGSVPSAVGDLIDSLQRQYWQALIDPSVVLAIDVWPSREEASDLMPPQAAEPEPLQSDTGSMEAWLGGRMNVDAAFDPLGPDENLDLISDKPVPEILRLFAPPEYHAAEARRSPDLLPPLTCREHHVLSVDSPMSMPFRPPAYGDPS